MAKGYWILRLDIADQAKYDAYRAVNGAALKKYGARFLVRAGRQDVAEGEARSRNSVVEFPSYEDAVACFRSPEYQAARALREGCGAIDIVIVEGYEGPQP